MMRMFLVAVAMATAAPAVAQTAAPAMPGANHAGHPVQKARGQGAPATQPGQTDPHAGHAMANGKDRMACCEKMADGDGCCCCAKQRQHGQTTADPHAGHDMSGGAHAGHGPNRN